MSPRARGVVYWLTVSVVCLLPGGLIFHFWLTAPRINDRPPGLLQLALICRQLHSFALDNPTGSEGKLSITNLDDLVSIGALSRDDTTYIRENQIRFYGFDPTRIGPDIPVFETPITWRKKPYLLVGYSDGHAAAHKVEKTP